VNFNNEASGITVSNLNTVGHYAAELLVIQPIFLPYFKEQLCIPLSFYRAAWNADAV